MSQNIDNSSQRYYKGFGNTLFLIQLFTVTTFYTYPEHSPGYATRITTRAFLPYVHRVSVKKKNRIFCADKT